MVIVVGSTAVLGFSFYLKRRAKSLGSYNPKQFDESMPPRSLFAPDAKELQIIELENEKRRTAKDSAEARLLKAEEKAKKEAEKAENVRACRERWQTAPDRKTTIELLRISAESGNAEIFSETAESVIELWRENKIENLTAPDLADLLDSHFRLLPQQERTSGAIFWVKREIENLRSRSEEIR